MPHFLSVVAQSADVRMGGPRGVTNRDLKESEVCTDKIQRCSDSRSGNEGIIDG